MPRLTLKRNTGLRRETYTVRRGTEVIGAVWKMDSGWWRNAGMSGFETRRAAVNDLVRHGLIRSSK